MNTTVWTDAGLYWKDSMLMDDLSATHSFLVWLADDILWYLLPWEPCRGTLPDSCMFKDTWLLLWLLSHSVCIKLRGHTLFSLNSYTWASSVCPGQVRSWRFFSVLLSEMIWSLCCPVTSIACILQLRSRILSPGETGVIHGSDPLTVREVFTR